MTIVNGGPLPQLLSSSSPRRPPFRPFLRQCIPLRLTHPSKEELAGIVAAHFSGNLPSATPAVVADFVRRIAEGSPLAIDQLLNAVYLTTVIDAKTSEPTPEFLQELAEMVWHRLTDTHG